MVYRQAKRVAFKSIRVGILDRSFEKRQQQMLTPAPPIGHNAARNYWYERPVSRVARRIQQPQRKGTG